MVSDYWLEKLENAKKVILADGSATNFIVLVKDDFENPNQETTYNDIYLFLADFPGYAEIVVNPDDFSDALKVGNHWVIESPMLTFSYNSASGPPNPNSIGWVALIQQFPDTQRYLVGMVEVNPAWVFETDTDIRNFVYEITNQVCGPEPEQEGLILWDDGSYILTDTGSRLKYT